MKKSKGGKLTHDEAALQSNLLRLGLFDRRSEVYRNLEHKMQVVTPERAFLLFCHACAARDVHIVEFPEGNEYKKAKDIQRRQYENRLETLKHISSATNITKLEDLMMLSAKVFMLYMDYFHNDYIYDMSRHQVSNEYKFTITASVLLGHIFHFYTEDQQKKIVDYLIAEHRDNSSEMRKIYERSKDPVSLEAMQRLFILEAYQVDIEDITNHLRSPFYLKDREALENFLYRDRYKAIKYNVTEVAGKNNNRPIAYKPLANIHINMDRSGEYIVEMLNAVQGHWTEMAQEIHVSISDREQLMNMRKEIMRYKKSQKTLAGKLTDMLYIYDMKSFGFTNTHITQSISSYWNQKKRTREKKEYLSTSSIHKYYRLTKAMIEDKHYMHY